ncbi:MAG: hypothetical protein M3O26_20880 [Pseudomonadota bacterium]|nr:hypothetical protein [Pseudomonadota bacterium]
MEKQSPNHGEGDPEAAERFNTAERDFVKSERGKKKIEQGVQARPGEEAELEEAEKRAGARAKADDSDRIARK